MDRGQGLELRGGILAVTTSVTVTVNVIVTVMVTVTATVTRTVNVINRDCNCDMSNRSTKGRMRSKTRNCKACGTRYSCGVWERRLWWCTPSLLHFLPNPALLLNEDASHRHDRRLQ